MRTLYLILFFVLASCSESQENHEVNEKVEKITFSECLKNSYPELTSKVYEFLPTMYPECDDFKISYRSLTKGQIDTTELFKKESIQHHLNSFEEADERLFNQEFQFEKIEHCSDGEIYQAKNKCAFYVGGVYISADKSMQLIRLYQEGEVEIFDMFIMIEKEEVKVLGFG